MCGLVDIYFQGDQHCCMEILMSNPWCGREEIALRKKDVYVLNIFLFQYMLTWGLSS